MSNVLLFFCVKSNYSDQTAQIMQSGIKIGCSFMLIKDSFYPHAAYRLNILMLGSLYFYNKD